MWEWEVERETLDREGIKNTKNREGKIKNIKDDWKKKTQENMILHLLTNNMHVCV